MARLEWKPGTMLYPIPAVMVTCGSTPEEYNIITIAWTGIISSTPPVCYISIRPERYSHGIIKKNMEFVINLTTANLAYPTDWCGVKSGREFNKFQEMKLTAIPATKVKAPLIQESPVNIECVVREIKSYGSHDMFVADIVAVNADDKYVDPETGQFNLAKADPICYLHGNYYHTGKHIGQFGFSVMKDKTKKKKGLK